MENLLDRIEKNYPPGPKRETLKDLVIEGVIPEHCPTETKDVEVNYLGKLDLVHCNRLPESRVCNMCKLFSNI